MVLLGRNVNTGKLYRGSGGKMCRGCCDQFLPEYSTADCCCFLDPVPNTWSGIKTYTLNEAVSYGGGTWYSTIANNLNHSPGSDGAWATYTACGNEEWSSVPPFGGIGKTPKYYAVSISRMGNYVNNNWNAFCQNICISEFTIEVEAYFILTYSSGCLWSVNSAESSRVHFSYSRSSPTGWAGCTTFSCESDVTVLSASCSLNLSTGVLTPNVEYKTLNTLCNEVDCPVVSSYPCSSDFYCNTGNYPCSFDVCALTDTVMENYNGVGMDTSCPNKIRCTYDIDTTQSWRPLDCNYTLYNTTTDYNRNACVSWGGYFWKCCIANGPGSGAGVQEPTGMSTACTGSDYWRLV